MQQLAVEKRLNLTKSVIAERIGKNASTIYRELRRNSDGRSGRYKAELTQRK